MNRAYLDHAASTPLRPGVADAMLPYLGSVFGNPSSSHSEGRAARQAIEEARDVIASLVGARPSEVVFTSGATESNNLFIRGAFEAHHKRVICSAIEHEAVMQPVHWLDGGITGVRRDGTVDLDALENAVDASVSVVSVMAANNETGMIQPIDEVVKVIRRRQPSVLIHTDAVQAISWCDPKLYETVDAFSISAHKFGGPKGIGALVIRDGRKIKPQLLGGGQEVERRSGTQNVAGIVGMATALRHCVDNRTDTNARVSNMRDQLADGLLNKIDGLEETGNRDNKLPNNVHIVINGVESEALVFMLDEMGVAASAASACASGAMQPSHVLVAMGYSREQATSSLRLTLGWNSTDDDVDLAIGAVAEAVTRLRSVPASSGIGSDPASFEGQTL